MGILSHSTTICRLCGLHSEHTVNIFEQKGLYQDLNFYLPLEIKPDGGPFFPKRICDGCLQDFTILKGFIVRLNEGQALLGEQLVQVDNVIIKVPNFLADKKSIFKEKFPSAPKAISAPKHKGLCVLVQNPPSESIPSKRTRKLPRRLAESVQGNELEKIFGRGETSSSPIVDEPSKVETDDHNPLDEVQVTVDNYNNTIVQDEHQSTSITVGHRSIPRRQRNKCDICFKVFKLQGRLAHHRSTVHRGAFFQCTMENCGKQYKTRESISLHHKMVGHEGMELIEPGKHTCDKCNLNFVTKSSLDLHNIEEHLVVGPLKCSTCFEEFDSFSDLRDHSQAVHGLDTLKLELACDLCSKTFATPSELYIHGENEHKHAVAAGPSSAIFLCKICSRPFKTKNLLTRHLAVVHTNNRPYACDECDLKFKSSTNLKAHQTMHTGEKRFSCEKCGKAFAYKTSLIQHIKLHEGDKPFQCAHCSKRFTQKGNLEEHIRTHTGEKPFPCTLCDRRFTTSSQHKMHEKRHKGEKPWQCETCPKAFLHKDTYKAHVRRHKGEKPFKCEFCSKAFAEIWALKKHKRLHTGEKPYKCKVCGKSFADSSNLTKHSRAHLRAGDEITAKDGTVWNIINHAAPLTNTTRDPIGQDEDVEAANDHEDNDDVQQIIYIAYEDGSEVHDADGANKETSIHILSQTTQAQQANEDGQLDLRHFSSASAVAGATTAVAGDGDTAESQLAIEHTVAGESDAAASGVNSTLHVIGQVPLDDGKLDPNTQYVDLSIKEGQQIRFYVETNDESHGDHA